MPSKDKNEKEIKKEKQNENGNENEDKNEDEHDDDDDETMSQNEKNEIMKGKNDILDKIIDKSRLFQEQIKSLKKQKI